MAGHRRPFAHEERPEAKEIVVRVPLVAGDVAAVEGRNQGEIQVSCYADASRSRPSELGVQGNAVRLTRSLSEPMLPRLRISVCKCIQTAGNAITKACFGRQLAKCVDRKLFDMERRPG